LLPEPGAGGGGGPAHRRHPGQGGAAGAAAPPGRGRDQRRAVPGGGGGADAAAARDPRLPRGPPARAPGGAGRDGRVRRRQLRRRAGLGRARAAMSGDLVYVYAVLAADSAALDRLLRDEIAGIDGRPVRSLREGALAAALSEVPAADFEEEP